MTEAIAFCWDGEAMRPVGRRFRTLSDACFVVGETYVLQAQEQRSSASHKFYFAAIRECWINLPDLLSDRFKTPEHLRKWALIRAGYRSERTHVAATKAEALRLAAFIKPIDDFAIVTTSGLSVTVWTAKSQSVKSMGKKEFERSKQAVLDILAGLIGVKADDLKAAAEAA